MAITFTTSPAAAAMGKDAIAFLATRNDVLPSSKLPIQRHWHPFLISELNQIITAKIYSEIFQDNPTFKCQLVNRYCNLSGYCLCIYPVFGRIVTCD
jgi:hypothetical protein